MVRTAEDQDVHACSLRACRQLTRAYTVGRRSGGSIEWADVDEAHLLAREAVRAERSLQTRGGQIVQISNEDRAVVLAALVLLRSQAMVASEATSVPSRYLASHLHELMNRFQK